MVDRGVVLLIAAWATGLCWFLCRPPATVSPHDHEKRSLGSKNSRSRTPRVEIAHPLQILGTTGSDRNFQETRGFHGFLVLWSTQRGGEVSSLSLYFFWPESPRDLLAGLSSRSRSFGFSASFISSSNARVLVRHSLHTHRPTRPPSPDDAGRRGTYRFSVPVSAQHLTGCENNAETRKEEIIYDNCFFSPALITGGGAL